MIELFEGDCLEVMEGIKDKSVDAIIIDPPYGLLKGHKIETSLDLDLIASEYFRVLKDDSFYVFFGVMPNIFEWYQSALKAGFVFRKDITWCKRVFSNPFSPITRMKETIFIMSKGKPKYVTTKQKYEDVKMPMYLDGLQKIDSLTRYVQSLRGALKRGSEELIYSNTKRNDEYYPKDKDSYSASRTPEFCGVSDVWSFMPQNRINFNTEKSNIKHPTVKPTLLMERIIKLCTKEGDLVLDSFMGSGSTLVACKNTNRNGIGIEQDSDYFEIAQKRIKEAQ